MTTPAPAPELSLTLVHKTTGEERMVRVVATLDSPIIIVNWVGCGDYAMNLEKNELFGYGPLFGRRRTPTGWGCKDLQAARELWFAKQDERRARVPVRTRAVRARQQKYDRLRHVKRDADT